MGEGNQAETSEQMTVIGERTNESASVAFDLCLELSEGKNENENWGCVFVLRDRIYKQTMATNRQ